MCNVKSVIIDDINQDRFADIICYPTKFRLHENKQPERSTKPVYACWVETNLFYK